MSFCEPVLRKAKGLRVDECEATYVRKKIITIRITDSEIAEMKQNLEEAISVRIVHKKTIMSAISSNREDDGIVERAMQTKSVFQPKHFWKSLPSQSHFIEIKRTYDKKLEETTGTQAAEIARSMIESSSHETIDRISGSLNIVSEYFEVSNTNGLDCAEKATYIAGTINTDSSHGSTPVSGIGAMSSRTLSSFSPKKIGSEAKEMCTGSINPQTCENGTYSIIFAPYAMGELLTFVASPNFSLKTYSEKRSCFTDKIGAKIAPDDFSLIDDPHLPDAIGSRAFDDEGVTTTTKHLVRSGIFSKVFSDSFYAFREGVTSTGNAVRMGTPMGRSAAPIPIPAPHNLVIKEGRNNLQEMIKDTKHGLLIGRLWYTYAVNPERGDFSCTARSGIMLVEGGRIVRPSKPVRIVHSLPDLFSNISDIGNDSRNVLQWHALPCTTPSLKVNGIRVQHT